MRPPDPSRSPALDHFVLSTRDLDRAAECYQRLGFHVMPRMKHIDLGSSNHVIQFRDTYLELVGDLHLGQPLLKDKMLRRFNAGDGLSINSLTSTDLNADRSRIEALGLNPEVIVSARRKVTMPDGSENETDSSCFYVWRDDKEYLSLFYSRHYKPESIFIPEYYAHHPNGIQGVYGLVYLSRDPAADADYFSTMFGSAPQAAEPGYLRYQGGRGDLLEVCAPKRLESCLPGIEPPDTLELAGYPVGLRMWTRSLSDTADWLRVHDVVDTLNADARILIGPELAVGAALEVIDYDALPASCQPFAGRQKSSE